MPNPWFRLYNEIIDDEKLLLLAFQDRWHFVALLALKNRGVLDENDGDMLQRKLCVKLGLHKAELEELGKRLSDVGLIHRKTFQPIAWDVRQFQSDGSTERVRAYRERMKRSGNVSVTAQDTETDTETETEKVKRHVRPRAEKTGLRFEEWWAVYPKKVDKKKSLGIWKSKKLDRIADTLIDKTRERVAADPNWANGYILNPTTYLNGERWNDEIGTIPQPKSKTTADHNRDSWSSFDAALDAKLNPERKALN